MTSGYGSLQFAFLGTYTPMLILSCRRRQAYIPGTGHYNCAGLYGTTCTVPQPKWRHRLRVTWDTPWDVELLGQLALPQRHEARWQPVKSPAERELLFERRGLF